jgi:hypothetical protein
MPNPDGEPQRILDAMLSMPGAEWEGMLCAYCDIVIFAVRMELMLDLEEPESPARLDDGNLGLVARALAAQYPGFTFSSGDLPSTDAVLELHAWVIGNVVRPPSRGGHGRADLAYQTQSGILRHPRLRNRVP